MSTARKKTPFSFPLALVPGKRAATRILCDWWISGVTDRKINFASALPLLFVAVTLCCVLFPLIKAPLLFDDLTVVGMDYSISSVRCGVADSVDLFSGLMTKPRPVRQFTHRLDARIAGADSTVFPHAINMALHLGVGLLFFLLLKKLGASYEIALIAVSIFLFNPVCIESVGVLSHRKEILSAFFILASFHALLAKSPLLASLSGFALLFAVFSKETAIVAPLLFFAVAMERARNDPTITRLISHGERIRFLWFAFATVLIGILAYIQIQYGMRVAGGPPGLDPDRPGHFAMDSPWPPVLSATIRSVPRYAALLAWPVDHTVDPRFSLSVSLLSVATIFSFLVCLIGGAVLVRLFRIKSPFLAPVLWMVFSLSPYLFPPLLKFGHTAVLADRYAYLASLGFAWALAIGMDCLVKEVHLPFLRFVLAAAVVAFFAICGWNQASDYRTLESFWARAVRLNPVSAPSRFNHALSLWREKDDVEAAQKEFAETLALDPRFTPAVCGYADCLIADEKGEQALSVVDQALAHPARHSVPELLRKRATLLLSLARFKESLAAFRAAEAAGVAAPAFQRGFAEACKRNLLWPEAVMRYRCAAEDPRFLKAYKQHRLLTEDPPLAVGAPLDIIVLGDSVPHGTEAVGEDGRTHSLAERLERQISCLRTLDASKPGLSAYELNRDFFSFLPSTNAPARICLIMAGHNDALFGRKAEGILFELSGCVFKARLSGMRPIVIGPICVKSSEMRDRIGQERTLTRLDVILGQFCKSARCGFVSPRQSFFPLPPPSGGWLDASTGNHLTDAGMEALAMTLTPILRSSIAQPLSSKEKTP